MKKGAFKKFLSELKRRNVYKSALAYIIASWIILQVLAVTGPSFKLPLFVIKWTVFALILGFPFWLIFSWEYEFTPEGLKKTKNVDPAESITPQTSNRLNKIIIGALGIAIVLLLLNSFGITSSNAENPIEKKGIVKGTDDKSIAVLAFADMSQSKDQEYFSDGISEEILNLLAKIPDLKVISRTSSFSFKDKDATVAEIGKALNVSHILEGSVRKSGNTLRITAQLINVENGVHLWSETYDKEMEDIFKIQDEIATAVSRELQATLLGNSIASKTVNPDAYDLYLRAKYEDRTAEGNSRAEGLLKQSIAIDSTYVPAWTLLSLMQLGAANFGTRSILEAHKLATRSAKKAIAVAPNDAWGYLRLAEIQFQKWEFEKAVSNAKKAMQLEPGNIKIKLFLAYINFASVEEKITLQKKLIALDPLMYRNYFKLGLCLYWDGRLEEAEAALRTYELHFPNSASLNYCISRVLLAQGKKEEALKEVEKEPGALWRLYGKNFVFYALGRHKEADSLLAEMKEGVAKYDAAANIAVVYAFRGDVEHAFLFLHKALEEKSPTLLTAVYYPAFKILYKDPRWNELINKMGLPKGHGVPMG